MSQPMYFPWPGMLEQIRLCDSYVYYDDVQFARGFFNRVQIKTQQGIRWLTVPLRDWRRGQLIDEVKIDNLQNWKRSHRDQLKQAYLTAEFSQDMLDLVDAVFSQDHQIIGDLAAATTKALINYFPLLGGRRLLKSSSLGIAGVSSHRLASICEVLKAGTYLTGHGARKYLNHEEFECKGMAVAYIDYGLNVYPQQHGEFTPYVSALDLIANCGRAGEKYIQGQFIDWREFTSRP